MKNRLQKGSVLVQILGLIALVGVVYVGRNIPQQIINAFAKTELGQTIATKVDNEKGPPGSTTEPDGSGKGTPQPPGSTPGPTPGSTPVGTPNGNEPYQGAPLCADSGSSHDTSKFHGLWDYERRCHYEHEHGDTPFTTQVVNAFPGFNVKSLLGNVEVGHSNLSSPLENTQKHGGFKWNTQLIHPEPCIGFESARHGANASVVQYHAFGDQGIELEARVHTTASLVRQCNTGNPNDFGYIYTIQFQDYGQRIVPYQGTVVAYPNQPVPGYNSARGPYLTADCVNSAGTNVIQCRTSLQQVLNRRLNVNSIWTSKNTGSANIANPFGSRIFTLLFRLSDGYRLFDWNDQVHPFTWLWVCSSDGGQTFNPTGCRYNNSTTQVDEISGNVPASWDNLAGFDTDSRVGRVTAQGYVTRFGGLNTTCTVASSGSDCFPIKMVNAFVGTWGSILRYSDPGKGTDVVSSREGDIYFCNGRVCNANDSGATPSGWIGQNN